MTPSPSTVESIAEAIGRPSRRTVAQGAAWSVPAIAIGIAAPANAASPGVCVACSTAPQQCLLDVGGTGNCSCAPGLVCVGTGPLGLANICVGADLAPLITSCGGTTCTGVCLAAGGALITAFNTLVAAFATFYAAATGLTGQGDTLDACIRQPGLPTNICVSPFADGGLGSLCIQTFSCGGNALFAVALNTLDAALVTFVNALSTAGILFSSSCQAPYVCQDGVSLAIDNDSGGGLLGGPTFAAAYRVGICQCGPQNSCPQPTDPAPAFEVGC